MGSPPLTWGIQKPALAGLKGYGITPTYVGNTLKARPFYAFFWDHPHLRGEYRTSGAGSSISLGSPPLTWGIRVITSTRRYWLRITPTYVGNTSGVQEGTDNLWDHPHLRGEYQKGEKNNGRLQGSPPLAWGIRLVINLGMTVFRITPTCVGNT